MIQLPENYMDTVRINPKSKTLLLHFKNDANQYYTYYYSFADGAQSLGLALEHLKMLKFEDQQPYTMEADLSTPRAEAIDQKWVPAPLPEGDMLTLAQYQAMEQFSA